MATSKRRPTVPCGFFSFDTRFLSLWRLSVNGERLHALAMDDVGISKCVSSWCRALRPITWTPRCRSSVNGRSLAASRSG